MSNNLVAERDGVMLHVGQTVVSLYKGGAVPDGADEAHVKLLEERGLLVPVEDEQNAPVENHDEAPKGRAAGQPGRRSG